jgi:G3E family GTPase
MTQVTIAFHPSVEVPPCGKSVIGATVSVEPAWSVRQLMSAIERHCAANGAGVRVCALINPVRRQAAPPHEDAMSHFRGGDRAIVVGDIRPTPWPSVAESAGRLPGSPVPVTIFTGFLGSGKTTVLNHLLQGQRDKKFAVIENEFGEVPIDNELLASNLGLAEQVVVMENGCMCCTVRGDLLGAFDAIRKQMEKGSPLDAVLVETTGMADPVPIVRTLRTTPDIAKYFQLDGTITLVDSKTVLDRLAESAASREGREDGERHRQIAFADKLLLNKVDLVSDDEAVEVWRRIRSYNESCPIISCVKGIVPAAELTNLGAFDLAKIVEEEAPAHGHGGHGHGHGHGGHGDGHECGDGCDHGGGHGHDDHGGGHGQGHVAGHGHSRHDNEIGSFSIVRHGVEADSLSFARWVRAISTLPEEHGKLYRSKGVIAIAGKPQKLIFHAVADVTETSDGPEWAENEKRCCKMVFIGKKLAKKEITERYLALLCPVKPSLRPPLTAPSPGGYRRTSLETLAARGVFCRALLACWSRDVFRVSQASALLHDAIFSPIALAQFQAAASDLPVRAPRGCQTVKGELWLHALLPMPSIKRYWIAWRDAQMTHNLPSSRDYLFGEPLWFDTTADVEAMAVTSLELVELKDNTTRNFVVEFRWRPETMASFFEVEGSATNSALVKVCIEDADGDSSLDDDLKFRINLNPEEVGQEGAATVSMRQHRVSIQLVGGKSSNHMYAIFFHTIDPTYQVHISVPDHRMPIFPTKEVFHQWHPLMNGLKRRPRLRFLIRAKPSELGPLEAMCGCC